MSATLTEFTLTNFKSYNSTSKLPLGTLTTLIGANASGKSNLIEGLRFLSWLGQGYKLSDILIMLNSNISVDGLFLRVFGIFRGQINNLCHYGESSFTLGCGLDSTEWNQLEITINVHDGEMHISREKITRKSDEVSLYEFNQPSTELETEVNVIYNNFKQGEEKPQINCSNQRAILTQLEHSAWFEAKYDESRKIIPKTVLQYQKALEQILFIDPVPARMRGYSPKNDKHSLYEDGNNLSSVLYNLLESKNNPNNEEEILNLIQSLPEQAIKGLDFIETPRDEVMVELIETFGNKQHRCEAALLSDGTLRVLAITAAILSASVGSLIVIEEIDKGVHPSRVKHLLASIRDIAERRQLKILLSTHNPALMDALPDQALGDVVFCYRDPQAGDSRLMRLGNLNEFPGLILQGPLGQLVTTGVVDRFVKSPRTPEQKKQQAMKWLSRLQEYE